MTGKPDPWLAAEARGQGGSWTIGATGDPGRSGDGPEHPAAYPYREVADFLAHQVDLVPQALDTLRYVDAALLARRIPTTCLLSVGLMDEICPPSTVFAAYNEIASPKEIAVHPCSGHDVQVLHAERRLAHLRATL